MKVLVAGHCCVDITPVLPGTSPGMEPGILYAVGPLRFKVGGSAPNSSGTLQALGADVELAVSMGDDELGHICRQQLDERGTKLHWTSSPLASSYSIVVEHGSHDRTFWQHEGSNATFDPRDLDLDAIAPDLLHLGYPSLLPLTCTDPTVMADAFASARARGITTSLDLAHVSEDSVASRVDWEDWFTRTLPHVDACSPSWDDVSSALGTHAEATRERLEETADRLLGWGAAVVSLSAGSLGFVLRTAPAERLRAGGRVLARVADTWADQRLWFPAEHVADPATTVGAGDALTGGLLFALTRGMDPQEAGSFARTTVGRHLRQVPLA
ncbi:sugar kinase [Tessaracoccus terricola]